MAQNSNVSLGLSNPERGLGCVRAGKWHTRGNLAQGGCAVLGLDFTLCVMASQRDGSVLDVIHACAELGWKQENRTSYLINQ